MKRRLDATQIDRRTVLRGVWRGSLIAMGLPPLEAMFDGNGAAYADGTAIPRRFGFVFWGDGVRLKAWNPAATGRGAAWALSPALAPFQELKPYLTVVSGTKLPVSGHLAGSSCVQTGSPHVEYGKTGSGLPIGTPTQMSIDQVVARALGEKDPLRSIEVGICNRVNGSQGPVLKNISHNGRNSPNPAIYDPREVWNKLFGAGLIAPTDPRRMERIELQKSALDLLRADAAALNQRLGAADRHRLAQHLEGLDAIQKQLVSLPAAACQLPGTPASSRGAGSDEKALVAVNRVMASLLAVALACRRTRVFSNQLSGSVDGTSYGWLGATNNNHGMTHFETGDQPIVHKGVVWKMERLAELLRALRDIPEGAGTLLDSCAIIATTDVSEGRSHSGTDMPVLIAGRAGGALRSDQHYRSTTSENTLKVHLTVLRALGMNVTSFGGTAGGRAATETIGALES